MHRTSILVWTAGILIGIGITLAWYQRCPDPPPVRQEQGIDTEWQPPRSHSSRYVTRLTGQYQEPDESYAGRLKYTQAYWCAGKDCTDWQPERSEGYPYHPVRHMSDDGYGNDIVHVNFEIDVPLEDIIRVKVTSVDKDDVESAGRIVQVR